MSEYLKDIPEFYERELGESIIARTEALGKWTTFIYIHATHDSSLSTTGTFRELGPPDLCHIVKANAKPGVREVSCPLSSTVDQTCSQSHWC